MANTLAALIRSKTFWTGLAAVATGVGCYMANEATAAQAAQIAFSGLLAVFLRAGLVKLPGGNPEPASAPESASAPEPAPKPAKKAKPRGKAGAAVGMILLLVAVGLVATGCTQQVATETAPVLVQDDKGNVTPVYDKGGQMLTRTTTKPAEHSFYEAQAKNDPIFEFTAPSGQAVTLPPGTRMIVRVPTVVKQYISEAVQAFREGKSLVPWFFGGWALEKMERTSANAIAAGGTRTTNVAVSGAGASASVGGGNSGPAAGNSTVDTDTTSTTTTTDDHSGAGEAAP